MIRISHQKNKTKYDTKEQTKKTIMIKISQKNKTKYDTKEQTIKTIMIKISHQEDIDECDAKHK